jgi:ABC-type multidrug transport system fused ATPase/permease subunit
LNSGAEREGVEGARNGRPALVRLFAYARPFAALILLTVVLAVALSGGRYARAYLMKPILDDVLLPQQTLSQHTPLPSWMRGIPFLGGEAPPDAAESAAPDPAEEARREALGRQIRESLAQVVLAALVLIAGMPLVMFARSYLVEYVLARVHIDIIRDVCAKLLALPLGYHHERARGDVLARTIQDAAIANRGVRLLFGDLIEAVVMIAVGGVALFLISWQLALISLVAGPAVFGVISLFSRRIRKSGHRRQEKVGDVTGRLVEILAGIKVIKAFRAEPVENAAFRRETRQLFRRGMRVAKYRVLARSLIEMLNNGVLIFPIFEAPIYALAALLSNFL